MSEFSTDSVTQAISNCGAVNVPNLQAGNYEKFLANVTAPVIPAMETVSDQEMVGDGFSRTIRSLRNTYWAGGVFGVQGLLNDHIASLLLNGWQGGAITPTPRTAPSKDIAAVMNVINSNPKMFNIFRKLGGEHFLHTSMAPDTFEIAQEGEADPTMNFGLRGTGHYLDVDELTPAPFEENLIQEAPEYAYFHGAATSIIVSDGVTSYNWTADGELISVSVGGNNKVDVRRRPGDTFKTSGNHNSGAFARKIRNGSQPEGSIKLKVDLRSDLREFKAMVANRKLTGLTVLFSGYDKIGAGADFHEFEIKAPKSQFALIEGDTDQDFGAISLNIQPLRDAITKGYFTNRTRTEKTLF